MIPQGGVLGSVGSQQAQQQTSRTYRIDPLTNRIVGLVDGLEAVKQAAYKIFQTERFDHLIYSGGYGGELGALPGKDSSYVQSELGRRIKQALLQDDRITDVQDMQITVNGDEAMATFTVVSIYGAVTMDRGIGISV
jgi:hypothetical protein